MSLDFLVAVRTLLKRPVYALSVVLTLALGIGASTMMFSLLDAAVLRTLPFEEPVRLVSLLGVAGADRQVRGASIPEARDWIGMNQTLEDVSVLDQTSLNLRLGEEAVRVTAEMVSPSYFPLLGSRASIGRTFLDEEDRTPDAHPVAVISDRLWRERFGADPDVLTRQVSFNDRPFSIVGVMPPGFSGLSFQADVWFPTMMVSLTSAPSIVQQRGTRWLTVVGRLKPGVTVERAQEDLSRVAAILEQQYPDNHRQRGVQVTATQEQLLGSTGHLLTALFGAVVLFLVIACANAANLQLARTIGRRRELAVRAALGASGWHVLRSVLAESVLLSALAGVAGAILAVWGLGAMVSAMPAGTLPAYVEPALNLRALAFAGLAATLSAALVAMLPALRSRGRDLADSIKDGARAVGGGLGSLRRPSAQQLLVVTEIALAMTLLAGAALLVRSLERQMAVNLGFDPAGVTVARISLPARYDPAARTVLVARLGEALNAVPQVVSAAVGSSLPLTGTSSASILMTEDADRQVRYYRHFITPDYFRTLGVRLTHGRDFVRTDTAEAPLVAILSDAGARRLYGSPDAALGRRMRLGPQTTAEIVGVVANARYRDLTTDVTAGTAEPDVFFPYGQRTDRDIQIAVRAAAGAPIPIGTIQQAVSRLDAGLPVYSVQLLSDAVASQTSTSRFGSALLLVFSFGALLLAGIGLYGLVAYVVGLSGREIAVRLALGARPGRVALLVVRNGFALVAAGVALGAGGAILAGRALETQLFETGARDPVILAAVATMLMLVAALATLIPARRAARIEPQAVLRAD